VCTVSWKSRANRNLRSVQSILYIPSDFAGTYGDYQEGIELAMNDIQFWYWRMAGKTFRSRPLKTALGTKPAVWFESQGMKEASEEVIRAGGFQPYDGTRIFISFSPAPKGWLGGTIGVDNWATQEEIGATYPWPGRTGLQGRGLDIMCGLPDPSPSTEWWSDEMREWRGAIAHELGHCICGLPHPDDDPATTKWEPGETLLFAWWNYPTIGLLPDEILKLRASPFFR